MKKILFLMTLLVVGVSFAFAQTNADIKFDKTTHDFGKFSENSPVVSCVSRLPCVPTQKPKWYASISKAI